MTVPIELIVTVTLSALGGALIPAIGLWLQFKKSQRELSLRHEEALFEKRLATALSISDTCYEYFAVSHRHRCADDSDYKKALVEELFQLGKRLEALEARVVLLFPRSTADAFRRFLSVVDDVRKSKEVHWTAVGVRLDEAFNTLIKSVRNDIGITSAEANIASSLAKGT